MATDLRVSLTDRCNLRCTYCMPAEGLDWLPDDAVLTDDEVVRLIRIGVERLGIREVRFTGGEPLVRRGLVDIVRRTREHAGPDLEHLDHHQRAGPARNAAGARGRRPRPGQRQPRHRPPPTPSTEITRRDRFDDVVAGLEAAEAAGLGPVKVNAVLLRGVNDDQAPELLAWCLERGYELRFIEQMPLDAQHGWSREEMVTAEEIFARLADVLRRSPRPRSRAAAPRPSCSSSTAAPARSASSPR